MSGQQGIAGRFGAHVTMTQDEMRQHDKDSPASGALNAPDGEAAEANPGIMGVARQRAAAVTGRFVSDLKPEREDAGQDELDKCFAIAKKLPVGGFIVEIDGERAVMAFGLGGLRHVSSPCQGWWMRMRHGERNALKDQTDCERIRALL